MDRMKLQENMGMGSCLLTRARGILFDMDGVLIDSEPAHEKTWVDLSEKLGLRFENAEAQTFKGMTEESTARKILEIFPEQNHAVEHLMELRREMYLVMVHQVDAIRGAQDFVRQCSGLGYAIALATSSVRSSQQSAFAKFGFDVFFDFVITGDDVTQGKPHPEPYLKAAEGLGLQSGECVVIEDSINGIRSAKSAGCKVIGLTTSFPAVSLREAGADLTADSFQELALAVS